MFLQQLYLECLAHASYVVGDGSSGVAAVVDPRRDVDDYLAVAAREGLRIEHVLLTHFHADFVAGHLELQERTGATIWLGARAEAQYDHSPLRGGDVVVLGDEVRLEARETPGHTPESICLLVHDRTSTISPHAVLTGDTLFIGDVGRPDLMASVGITAEELAGMLYDSLHRELLTLPDDTLVYPAHGAGSMCGKSLSNETVSTIGEQRASNYALQPMSREEFVAMATAGLPEAPPYFSFDARLNREGHETLSRVLEGLRPLAAEEVRELVEQRGAQLLDVRPAETFAVGHVRGAVNIGLDGRFASWAGTLLSPERPIVLIARKGEETEAATRLGRIGFDDVAGYFAASGDTQATTLRIERHDRLAPEALAGELAGASPPLVLDVRTPAEWDESHLEGAVHIPLAQLRERHGEIPRDRRVVAMCRTGYRSAAAVSLLAAVNGFEDLGDLAGGIEAWKEAGQPLVG